MRYFLSAATGFAFLMAAAGGAYAFAGSEEEGQAAESAPKAEESAEPSAEKGKKAKKQKRICRSVGTTGSRLGGQRICKTKDEWDKDARRAREETGK